MISKANVKNIYPLTPLQEGILFHDLYDGGAAYFEQLCYRLRGSFDVECFRFAWDELVRRHDVLRTIFVHKDTPRPLQIVLKEWRIEFTVVDSRALFPHEAQQRIDTLKQNDRRRPFLPSKEPLTRITVILLCANEVEVIWSHHHIILDGWSVGILQSELLDIYAAQLHGKSHVLAPPIPFSHYVTWIEKQDTAVSQHFWQEMLDGFSQATGLPQCPTTENPNASRMDFIWQLDPQRTAQLTTIAATSGVTLNVLVQTVWSILLSRYNGTDDVVFAATVSGRPEGLRGVETMVGLFINAVPVRIRLQPTATLPHVLRTVQRDTLAAARHHWCSLAEIQAATPLRQGLLDHILIFENYPLDERLHTTEATAACGFTMLRAELHENTNYPFELSVVPSTALTFRMGYDPNIYAPALIERIAWSLEFLFDQVVEQPARLIAEFSVLAPQHIHEITAEFNTPPKPFAHVTVADLLTQQALATPDRTALVCESRRLAYRELHESANRVANFLLQQFSVKADQVVAILMDRSERMVAALYGIIQAGAAYLPLDPTFPAARTAYMLQDSGCRIVLTEAKHRHLLFSQADQLAIVELDTLPDATTTAPHRIIAPENLLYLMYTSGSTGLPKGVMLEHRHVVSFLQNMTQTYGLTAEDTLLAVTTITFDISVLELICPLMLGMTIVVANDTDANSPSQAVALLQRERVTVLQVTPSRLKLMLESSDVAAFAELNALLVGGEPLPESMFQQLQALHNTALFNVYGPTEATIWSTTKRLNGAATLTIGTPLIDEEVLILAPDSTLQPVGVWGEICIGGQGVARGYWQRPELTSERFTQHPLRPAERIYRTGDSGRWLPCGELQCGGRLDTQVKVRGYRIEIGEIEHALLALAGVQTAVVRVVDMNGVNEIAAYLVSDQTPMPTPHELRAQLSTTLPDYMLPTWYIPIDAIPLTPNGKTDRNALPHPSHAASRHSDTSAATEPYSETERRLAQIWQRILGIDHVGRHDSFFDLGGHSIKAIRMGTAIAKEFGQEIPLSLIFAHPTIATFAQTLMSQNSTTDMLQPLAPREWYPASAGQRRMWVLQQMAPESPAYTMPLTLKLGGGIDRHALQSACAILVARHESLRTIFAERDGMPVQVVLTSLPDVFSFHDLREVNQPWDTAMRAAADEIAIPFDMTQPSLWRVHLFQTATNEALLLLTMHHSIGDGWSWNILLREWVTAYRAIAGGATPTFAPLAIQYKEWADHQHSAMATTRFAAMRRYWQSVFAAIPAPLELPLDFPRPRIRREDGASTTLTLEPAVVSALHSLAAKREATLFMGLLAILNTLLFRLSGQSDLTVGIPVAGRPHHALEGVVGFFVNTLALRNQLEGTTPFTELLDQTRSNALAAYEHQLYPFDTLVGELALPRDTARTPLFDVMAVLHETGAELPTPPDLSITAVPALLEYSRFDMTWNFSPQPDGSLQLLLEYATALFRPETAQRMAARFVQLVRAVTEAPATSLQDLQLLPASEQAELQQHAAGTTHPNPVHTTMSEQFRHHAAQAPDAVALIAADRTICYGELDRLSDLCAASLHYRYVMGIEEPIGVMTGRNSHLIIALLGVLKGGGVYLPIDSTQPENRIRHILSDSGVRRLLVDHETSPRAATFQSDVTLINIESIVQGETPANVPHSPVASSAAYIIYTSGSTGLPKGVLLEHGGFMNMICDQIRTFGIAPQDRCLLFSSFSFDGAMSEIFLALHAGATLVIASQEQVADPILFSAFLQQREVTVATLPPVYLNALRANSVSLDPLRILITAGEAAIAHDLLAVARDRIFNAYGPTEASVCSAIHRVDPTHAYHDAIPIGNPMANSELLILDDQLQLVPYGVTGEICVAGPGLARGYIGSPERTAEKFVAHPYRFGARLYRTGDRGFRTYDGAVQFVGRQDDQVKLRGYRIECGEIERALINHPLITGATVLVQGEGSERELVAFLLAESTLETAEVKIFLGQYLPAYMIPSRYHTLATFPQNSNGKVDRQALLRMEHTAENTPQTCTPPTTPMERQLATLWEQILQRTGLGRDDSFFDAGGQSIAAMHLVAAIKNQLNLTLPLPFVFRFPTLRAMAQQCEQIRSFCVCSREEEPLCLQAGSGISIFAFPPITGYPMAYSGLARSLGDHTFYGFTFLERDDRLKRYRMEIERLQPQGVITLLGYSSGGNLAFEVAKELEKHGRTVARLIVLDSWIRLASRTLSLDSAYAKHLDMPLSGEYALAMEHPQLRALAQQKLYAYLHYIDTTTTEGVVAGDIVLLQAEASELLEGMSQTWGQHTAGAFHVLAGSGTHLTLLDDPWVKTNGSLVKVALDESMKIGQS